MIVSFELAARLASVPVTGERVRVKIPPRVTEGTRLRLAQSGAPADNGNGRGDLYLVIHMRD